ncbi:uncharacterized protein LOC143637236 [Bidens hawaiensis]|uniref:uncharacterized protein LOC143637236 n=1 Tax=Bidens hawaiensis TaxID=980011 RepID=UPI004049D852
MANTTSSLVAAVVFIIIACVDAYTTITVYRVIQYDISGAPFGSRAASLDHHAASISSSLPACCGSDLSRTVLILSLHESHDRAFIREYIEHGKKQPLGGLLLILPQAFGFPSNRSFVTNCIYTSEKQLLADFEQNLIHSTIQYPVYFALEDIYLRKLYKVTVASPPPKKLASPTITSIQGWLPGLKADDESSPLPTIAIVSSYDTFGAAPALSAGSDSNGSGVAALLEIARLFSILYDDPETRGRYNILFGLTSGGPYNYIGTQKWLRRFNESLLESIEYAICLNSFSSGENGLWLHVSKHPENAHLKKIFKGLSNVAEEIGLKVALEHKKINVSDSRVDWEHEQFERLRVTAVTLSGRSVAPSFLENTGGISDNRSFVDEYAFVPRVKLVAESLARHIYGQEDKNTNILDKNDLAVSHQYIGWWLDILSETPRVAPFLSKDNPFIMALKTELADHVEEVSMQHDEMDGMFTFYDSTANTMQIYEVKFI